jgi:hypothetical protein
MQCNDICRRNYACVWKHEQKAEESHGKGKNESSLHPGIMGIFHRYVFEIPTRRDSCFLYTNISKPHSRTPTRHTYLHVLQMDSALTRWSRESDRNSIAADRNIV